MNNTVNWHESLHKIVGQTPRTNDIENAPDTISINYHTVEQLL